MMVSLLTHKCVTRPQWVIGKFKLNNVRYFGNNISRRIKKIYANKSKVILGRYNCNCVCILPPIPLLYMYGMPEVLCAMLFLLICSTGPHGSIRNLEHPILWLVLPSTGCHGSFFKCTLSNLKSIVHSCHAKIFKGYFIREVIQSGQHLTQYWRTKFNVELI